MRLIDKLTRIWRRRAEFEEPEITASVVPGGGNGAVTVWVKTNRGDAISARVTKHPTRTGRWVAEINSGRIPELRLYRGVVGLGHEYAVRQHYPDTRGEAAAIVAAHIAYHLGKRSEGES